MPSSDQGPLHDRYRLIPRTLVFVTQGERLLLLKGAPHKRLWANRYNGVGGHVERGESILAAARRELAEETGLELPQLWLRGIATIDTGEETGILLFILRAELGPSAGPIPERMHSSDGDLQWVAFDDIQDLPLVEDLYLVLPRLLKSRPADPPFFAHYAYDQAGRLQVNFDP